MEDEEEKKKIVGGGWISCLEKKIFYDVLLKVMSSTKCFSCIGYKTQIAEEETQISLFHIFMLWTKKLALNYKNI